MCIRIRKGRGLDRYLEFVGFPHKNGDSGASSKIVLAPGFVNEFTG